MPSCDGIFALVAPTLPPALHWRLCPLVVLVSVKSRHCLQSLPALRWHCCQRCAVLLPSSCCRLCPHCDGDLALVTPVSPPALRWHLCPIRNGACPIAMSLTTCCCTRCRHHAHCHRVWPCRCIRHCRSCVHQPADACGCPVSCFCFCIAQQTRGNACTLIVICVCIILCDVFVHSIVVACHTRHDATTKSRRMPSYMWVLLFTQPPLLPLPTCRPRPHP